MSHTGTCIISIPGPANLDLQSNGLYVKDGGVDIGQTTHRRIEATSPYLDGSIPTSQVKDNAKAVVTVNVEGPDQATINTLLAGVVAAFSQWQYLFSVELDSTLYTWLCYKSDYKVSFAREAVKGLVIPVTFSFPRYPVPIYGGV